LLFFAAGLVSSPLTFSMNGTFNSSQTADSPYFAPDTTWSLSFVADSNPVVLASATYPAFSYFQTAYTGASYAVGGSAVSLTGNQVFFYTNETLDICLDSSCDYQISFGGPQIFTGPVTSPSLSPGSYPSTATTTVYWAPSSDTPTEDSNPGVTVQVSGASSVPEPATIFAVVGGLLALGLARRSVSLSIPGANVPGAHNRQSESAGAAPHRAEKAPKAIGATILGA